MKPEQLKRANEITKELRELNEHRKIVANNCNRYGETKSDPFLPNPNNPSNAPTFSIEPYFSSDPRKLMPDLLPIAVDKFMRLYIMNVEAKIKELETEFEKL